MMDKPTPLSPLLLTAATAAFVLSCTKAPTPKRVRPNIVLIIIDTARADHFSAYGYTNPTTPHFDSLARDGILFTSAHSTAPWTLPAHMSLFTGLYPSDHGATWEAFSQPAKSSLRELLLRPFSFAEPERLLAVRLQKAGYATAAYSSNGWVGTRTGMAAGFDSFVELFRGPEEYVQRYDSLPERAKNRRDFDMTMSGAALVEFKNHRLQAGNEKPFFAFFNFIGGHFRYLSPPPFDLRFNGDPEILEHLKSGTGGMDELALLAGKPGVDFSKLVPFYDSALSYADYQVGELISWLKRNGQYDDTLIIVTSDHGEHLGEEGRFSHQLSIAEELLHIPLVIKLPKSERAGEVNSDALASLHDIYTTILEVARAPEARFSPEPPSLSLLERVDERRSSLLAEYFYSEAYLRQLTDAWSVFDPTPHRVVRRAVFHDGTKGEFADQRLVEVTSMTGATPDGARERLRESFQRHVTTNEGRPLIRKEAPSPNDELVDHLRALGYVGDAE